MGVCPANVVKGGPRTSERDLGDRSGRVGQKLAGKGFLLSWKGLGPAVDGGPIRRGIFLFQTLPAMRLGR
jgi:hypothetical protein